MASETPSVSAQSTSSALKTSETELRGALQGITLLGEVAVEFRGHLSHPPADHEAVPTIQEWQGLNQQVQGWYGNASTLLTGWEQRESISTAALQKTQSDVESLRKSLQDERNAMAAERARLADERDAVTAEAHSDVESLRKSLQNERDAVAAERTKLANERDAVAAERAKLTEEYKKVLASGGQLVDSMNAAKSAERSYRKKGTQILWGLNEVQRKRVEWLETFKQGLNVELSKVQENTAVHQTLLDTAKEDHEKLIGQYQQTVTGYSSALTAAQKDVKAAENREGELTTFFAEAAEAIRKSNESLLEEVQRSFRTLSSDINKTRRDVFQQQRANLQQELASAHVAAKHNAEVHAQAFKDAKETMGNVRQQYLDVMATTADTPVSKSGAIPGGSSVAPVRSGKQKEALETSSPTLARRPANSPLTNSPAKRTKSFAAMATLGGSESKGGPPMLGSPSKPFSFRHPMNEDTDEDDPFMEGSSSLPSNVRRQRASNVFSLGSPRLRPESSLTGAAQAPVRLAAPTGAPIATTNVQATPDVAVAASNTPAAAPRAPAAPSAPSASNVVAPAPNVVAAAAVPLSDEVKEVYENIQFPSQETWTPDMDATFRKALMEVPGGGLQGHFDKNASGRKNKHPPTPRNCLLSEIGHRACVIPDGEDLRSSCPFCSTPAGADQLCVHLLYVPGVDDPMGTRKANGRYIKDSAKPVAEQTTKGENGKRWVLGVRT